MAPVKSLPKPLQSATIKDYLAILVRRRWIIGISFLTVMLSTVYYVYRLEDVFESFSTLVIEEKSALINDMLAPPDSLHFLLRRDPGQPFVHRDGARQHRPGRLPADLSRK